MTCVSHPRHDELRELGWTRLRGKARRPYPVRREDILYVTGGSDWILVDLEEER